MRTRLWISLRRQRPKKKSNFRLQGKNFTITFPQCDVPRTTAVERICAKYGDELQGYIVCEELHKDGTPHLHVFLQFKEKLRTSDPHFFDFIGGQHGNYQVTKNVRKWVTYITKEENYTAKGVDVKSIKSKKAPKNEEVAQMIMEGKSLREINEKNPGYVMLNKRKLEEYESWISCERSKKSKIDWIQPKLDGLTGSQLKIAEWICKNIRQQRSFKAPQLFITGTANLGKTSLVEWLEITISVPYTNNGRVLRPIFGRLRPSSHGRIQRSENYSMDEYVSTGVTYEYPKEGIPIHEDEEYAGYYFV